MTPQSGRTEDQALLARVTRGDRSALEQLYHRHVHWMTLRLETRCADEDLVDMAVQDTFIAVWNKPKAYRGDGDVGAWLWGIAIRRLIDQLRKRRPVPRDLGDLDVPPTSFEEELLASGAYGTVGDAVRDLDPDLQEVLVLTAVDGLSTRDAARLLDIPQGTVKTRLHRARRQLQSRLPHSGEPREDHR